MKFITLKIYLKILNFDKKKIKISFKFIYNFNNNKEEKK